MARLNAIRTAFQPLLIRLALICALASVLPSAATTQQDRYYMDLESAGNQPENLPPAHTPIDWSNLDRYFLVGPVLWHTPTQFRFQLRAKAFRPNTSYPDRLSFTGSLYVKAYYGGEWYDRLPVEVDTKYRCGSGPPECRLWVKEEAHEIRVSLPSNPSKIKFEFEERL